LIKIALLAHCLTRCVRFETKESSVWFHSCQKFQVFFFFFKSGGKKKEKEGSLSCFPLPPFCLEKKTVKNPTKTFFYFFFFFSQKLLYLFQVVHFNGWRNCLPLAARLPAPARPARPGAVTSSGLEMVRRAHVTGNSHRKAAYSSPGNR
jgi:hypothetical protein